MSMGGFDFVTVDRDSSFPMYIYISLDELRAALPPTQAQIQAATRKGKQRQIQILIVHIKIQEH